LEDLPRTLVSGHVSGERTYEQVFYQRQTRWDDVPAKPTQTRFRAGMRVVHPAFGEGVVLESRIDFDDEEVAIAFEGGETKHLVASMANLEILGD
jgi:DNA helicase-2/ATP-dependent DNA helicase PcrA